MNVNEINNSIPTLGNYLATALPLTAVTIWIVVALQIQIEDKSTGRRHRRSARPQNAEPPPAYTNDILQSPIAVDHPPGHGFRPARTTTGGEIILEGHYSSDINCENHDDDENDKYEDENDIYTARHRRYNEFKNSSLWKRLAWPVSLTHTAYTSWQEDRQERTQPRTRRTPPRTVKTDNEERGRGRGNLIPHILPRFFLRRGSGAMTEAEKYVEDVRSQHSDSKLNTPQSATSFPKSILKGKEKAAEVAKPGEPVEVPIDWL